MHIYPAFPECICWCICIVSCSFHVLLDVVLDLRSIDRCRRLRIVHLDGWRAFSVRIWFGTNRNEMDLNLNLRFEVQALSSEIWNHEIGVKSRG